MSEEQQWRVIAQRTSRKINLGWWLQVLSTPLLITGLIIACGILIMRRELETLPSLYISLGTIAVLSLTGFISWLFAKPKFESSKESLVRLEASMSLRNALTAADHEVAPWPDVPAHIDDGTRWHWKRILPPILGSVLIIASGFFIPIHAKTDLQNAPQQPSAWNELETNLNQLGDQDIVQEEYIDEMREKLEKLREQSPDEWFSHSSLEATDTLKQNHQNEQESLRNKLQRAESNLSELQHGGSKMNKAQRERLLEGFDQALQQMQQGNMKPNEELLKQLQELDPQALGELTPEQMDQLRKNMREHAEKLKQQGEGQEGDQDCDGDGENEGEGGEEGEGNQQPGNGGINRGPGTAPDLLGDLTESNGKGKFERLESNNLQHALPGDLLTTQDGEHDVDKSPQGLTAGGTSSSKGQGGGRVWRESLLPEEKKALKKFFE